MRECINFMIDTQTELKKTSMALGRTTLATILLLVANSFDLARAGPTADGVLKKGFVQCGVNTGLAGFAQPDSKGEWRGIDVD